MLTGDRDMFQAATKQVTVLLLGGRGKKGPQRIDPAEVESRYGIPPEQRARLHRPPRRPF